MKKNEKMKEKKRNSKIFVISSQTVASSAMKRELRGSIPDQDQI